MNELCMFSFSCDGYGVVCLFSIHLGWNGYEENNVHIPCKMKYYNMVLFRSKVVATAMAWKI